MNLWREGPRATTAARTGDSRAPCAIPPTALASKRSRKGGQDHAQQHAGRALRWDLPN